jgi:hypothetical protein
MLGIVYNAFSRVGSVSDILYTLEHKANYNPSRPNNLTLAETGGTQRAKRDAGRPAPRRCLRGSASRKSHTATTCTSSNHRANALEQTRAGARPLTDRSLDHRTVRRETNEGNDMTRDLQGEMITALENYRNAFENGTLNLEIVRTLIAAIIAAR